MTSPPAGQTLYGRVLWSPEQNLNAAYRLQLEKVYLCTGRDGYVPFFDPTGTLYNEGLQYGCIQPNKHLKHRFLLLVKTNTETLAALHHGFSFSSVVRVLTKVLFKSFFKTDYFTCLLLVLSVQHKFFNINLTN